MASAEAIAIRCDKACERIETALGVESHTLRRVHKDKEELRAIQLETIADWVESMSDLNKARDLIQSGNWTKAQMEVVLLGEAVKS